MQKFLEIALDELGVHEIPGRACNERIKEYATTTSLKSTSDEVPWCSAFANWVVKQAGCVGTGSAAARSWLAWGKALDRPEPGCIVVFDRHDSNNPTAAHVTFFVCETQDKQYIDCVGGNQGDQVKRTRFPISKVLGYRDAS